MNDTSYAVFVLGAGASKEYGLPLGSELKNSISQLLEFKFNYSSYPESGDIPVFEALKTFQPDFPRDVTRVNQLLATGREIVASLPQAPSIDQFIFNHSGRSDVEAVGKIAIARAIQIQEGKSKIAIRGPDGYTGLTSGFTDWKTEGTWLPRLFSILVDGCASLDALEARLSKIKVISFNYDRVFKHYIYNALNNYYSGSKDRIAKIVSGITVIHPYGSLGKLEWEGNRDGLGFGRDLNGASLASVATGIKTFNESVESSLRDQAREAIARAKLIMFLGFGFHQQNIDFLSSKNEAGGRIFGTARGVSDFDRLAISSELAEKLSFGLESIHLHNGDCASLFSEYSRALRLVGI